LSEGAGGSSTTRSIATSRLGLASPTCSSRASIRAVRSRRPRCCVTRFEACVRRTRERTDPMTRAQPLLLLLLVCACDTVDLGPALADVNACRPSQSFFTEQIWPNFLAKDYGGKHCYDARC